MATATATAMARPGGGRGGDESWEYSLRKYLLLLATLVATVTYSAGFNPPGGVWQTSDPTDPRRIAGDPIIRVMNYPRYLAFFYSNATAFASSLVVIVLLLILSVLHDNGAGGGITIVLGVLRVVMVVDLLSLMGAYAAGAFRDALTAIYSLILCAGVVVYLVAHFVVATKSSSPDSSGQSAPERLRKVLMLLATFAASVTYLAGLSAPGGFWDHAEDGHEPGEAILKGGPHDARLKAFFVCNTTAFVASLLILVMLLERKLCFSQKVRSYEIYGFIAVTLLSLLAAYAAGGSRQIDTTVYVSALVGAVAVFVLIQVVFVLLVKQANSSQPQRQQTNANGSVELQQTQGPQTSNGDNVRDEQQEQTQEGLQTSNGNVSDEQQQQQPPQQTQSPHTSDGNDSDQHETQQNPALEKARSLVLLLATLATAITYQAGLNPPGGLWQSNDVSGAGLYMIGDPILLTTNHRRYNAFYYCNSLAFVASLVAIVLVRQKTLHHHNALEAAMVLDLFGLIGAYAAGSCRDVSTSIYVMALAGAALVYVVIHVVFLTLDHNHNDGSARGASVAENDNHNGGELEEALVEKRRKRLLLFAILAATITYQAGLTPPGGFLVQDDSRTGRRAGDAVLLNNYPRRYTAFFYCNSVSFMLSIALVILLVNPNLYRPAIRSNALSVCTAAGLIGIMGGYAAGCTQHLKTSIYIFALAAVVLSTVVLLVAVFLVIHLRKPEDSAGSNRAAVPEAPVPREEGGEGEDGSDVAAGAGEENAVGANEHSRTPERAQVRRNRKEKRTHAKRKYLMLLGILVASVTYQAGLAPPGGSWQSNDGAHTAGDPVMHDNRRARYLAFFYSNSTSFVASVVVIVLLLPASLHKKWWWLGVMNFTIVLDLLGLLIAYAAGSGRTWKTSVKVSALVLAVLAYFAVHVFLSRCARRGKKTAPDTPPPPQPQPQENGERNEAAVQLQPVARN